MSELIQQLRYDTALSESIITLAYIELLIPGDHTFCKSAMQ